MIIAVDGHKIDGAMDIIKQLKKKHPGINPEHSISIEI